MTDENRRNDSDTGVWWVAAPVLALVITVVILRYLS
jgi:ABC-type dipeptide/oligopeptide/nickel transport system permease subunit